MSLNIKSSMKRFYENLGRSAVVFKQHVDGEFLPELKKPFIRGGARKAQRKQAVQEAVDAIQCYGELNSSDAASKRLAFENSYRAIFKEGLPANSPTSGVQSSKIKLIAAKHNILLSKLRLLKHWKACNEGYTPLELGADWKNHFLYQFESTKVKPILQILLNDARDVLEKKTFTANCVKWLGTEAVSNMSFTSTNISQTVKFDAMARAGFEGSTNVQIEYKKLKGELNASVFAGARGRVEGEASFAPNQVSLAGKVQVDVGIVLNADAKFNINDILEFEATAEGLAGAQLNVGGKIVVSYQGVELQLDADAFAGLRIKGSAAGTLKLGGREISKIELSGAAWAGAGVSGSLGFKCSVFGDISFNLQFGAAVGVGAEGGISVNLDPSAIKYGALNLIYIYAAEHGIKNRGRTLLLPLEENQKMGDKAIAAIKGMMNELKQQNMEEIEQLIRWNRIKRSLI